MSARKNTIALFIPLLFAGVFISALAVSVVGQIPGPDGLAGRYPLDKGIEKDPNVIVFTGFESDDWRKKMTALLTHDAAVQHSAPLTGAFLECSTRCTRCIWVVSS